MIHKMQINPEFRMWLSHLDLSAMVTKDKKLQRIIAQSWSQIPVCNTLRIIFCVSCVSTSKIFVGINECRGAQTHRYETSKLKKQWISISQEHEAKLRHYKIYLNSLKNPSQPTNQKNQNVDMVLIWTYVDMDKKKAEIQDVFFLQGKLIWPNNYF